jgi:hypothetical protein
MAAVLAASASTRSRDRAGSTRSSLPSARTDASPTPCTACPAATRSPTATATVSSSSSGSPTGVSAIASVPRAYQDTN